MLVVLDSNVLLSAIGPNSPLHGIWKSFVASEFSIAVNEDILKEYEEILLQRSAPKAAKIVMEIFEESEGVLYQRVSYKWDAIKKDRDDNKFFDVAVASAAHYLVTNDKHFKEAQKLIFPEVTIIGRLDVPFLRPMEAFEKSGQYIDGTVFIEGLVYFEKKWFLYYGCADSRVAVAIYDPANPASPDPLP